MCDKKKEQLSPYELELVAEQELLRLQRQFRIMEGDRGAYSCETDANLKIQRRTMKALKKEQSDIIADLKVATSKAKKKEDELINNNLEKLLEEHDIINQNLKIQKSHLNELDYQIKKMEKEVQDIKKKTITDLASQARIISGQKMLKAYENRLEVIVRKFNTVTSENCTLREEIDHLLKERAHFNNLWEKLITCLNQGKKFMLDLIEQASLAYDQREEWCSKLAALRQRGTQELVHHTQEMRQLQRRLDHDIKLQEFLGVKGQRRIMSDLEQREARKREQMKETMERQLQMYKQTLAQIQEFSHERDIERLAAQFIKQEEENFALFNYVNELNHESECLSTAIAELRRNIDEQRELHQQRQKQQKENIKQLELKFKEEKQKADATDKDLKKFNANLAKVLNGVENIFKQLKCDKAPILELLGDNAHVTAYNFMMYIGLIEQRVTELLQCTYLKEKSMEKVKRAKVPPSIIKPDQPTRYIHNTIELLVPTQPCPLCVEQEQVSDVIDTLQCAKNHNEVEIALQFRLTLPHALDRLHNVSACHLPQSRRIIQQRYAQ